jgi:hypothetical protein
MRAALELTCARPSRRLSGQALTDPADHRSSELAPRARWRPVLVDEIAYRVSALLEQVDHECGLFGAQVDVPIGVPRERIKVDPSRNKGSPNCTCLSAFVVVLPLIRVFLPRLMVLRLAAWASEIHYNVFPDRGEYCRSFCIARQSSRSAFGHRTGGTGSSKWWEHQHAVAFNTLHAGDHRMPSFMIGHCAPCFVFRHLSLPKSNPAREIAGSGNFDASLEASARTGRAWAPASNLRRVASRAELINGFLIARHQCCSDHCACLLVVAIVIGSR